MPISFFFVCWFFLRAVVRGPWTGRRKNPFRSRAGVVLDGPRGKSLDLSRGRPRMATLTGKTTKNRLGRIRVGRNNDRNERRGTIWPASSETMIMMMEMGTGVWVPSGWEIYEGC